jgi:hypothetical protein
MPKAAGRAACEAPLDGDAPVPFLVDMPADAEELAKLLKNRSRDQQASAARPSDIGRLRPLPRVAAPARAA